MSSRQEIEQAIASLPRAEIEAVRDWLENFLEDQQEMTDQFAAKIQRAEAEMAAGQGRPHQRP